MDSVLSELLWEPPSSYPERRHWAGGPIVMCVFLSGLFFRVGIAFFGRGLSFYLSGTVDSPVEARGMSYARMHW
jgi:hypothetical protein